MTRLSRHQPVPTRVNPLHVSPATRYNIAKVFSQTLGLESLLARMATAPILSKSDGT